MSTLVGTVADSIAAQNPAAAMRFTRGFRGGDNDIPELNRYWRGQLAQLHVSTVSERMCLIDDIDESRWLHHFTKLVLPLVIKSDLPRA